MSESLFLLFGVCVCVGIFVVEFYWNGQLQFVLRWLVKYGDIVINDGHWIFSFFKFLILQYVATLRVL